MSVYEGIDAATVAALAITPVQLEQQKICPMLVHEDMEALRHAMALRLYEDITTTLRKKRRCTFIVPVGPVGQYELLADRCLAEGTSLSDVTFIIMDEYLDVDNRWIASTDPLSFRGHMHRNLMEKLSHDYQPTIMVPDPMNLDEIPSAIAERGLDFTYAGVGITGHLAFNDPVPGRDDPDWFANLPTRIVQLSPQTRLINAVTAAMGNTSRIPEMAVTVGMREILGADTLRIWMNRTWQCAAVRRMLFGPCTAVFPASLAQRHSNYSLDITREVLALPEPALK